MKLSPSRAVAFAIGVTAAALSAYGAYEMQLGVEKSVNYLVIAAPFVVVTAAIIPPLAEATWRSRGRVKAALWWLALIPAAALAFFVAYERVHIAKAGDAAERLALKGAVTRAEINLGDAREALAAALAEQSEQLKLKACRDDCQAKYATNVATARLARDDAADALTRAEAKVVVEPDFMAPLWLLPACLDLIGFMAIWTAFAPPPAPKKPKAKRRRSRLREWLKRRREAAKAAPVGKRQAAPVDPAAARKRRLHGVVRKAGNDNVFTFPAA